MKNITTLFVVLSIAIASVIFVGNASATYWPTSPKTVSDQTVQVMTKQLKFSGFRDVVAHARCQTQIANQSWFCIMTEHFTRHASMGMGTATYQVTETNDGILHWNMIGNTRWS